MNFKPGETIGGRFQVQKRLGQGGVGIVYLVMDMKRIELCAMKVLIPELADNQLAIARLKREVQAMRKIEHPGIVKIFDTGRIEKSLFYTMEYVYGSSLAAVLQNEGPMALSRAVALMGAICEVLEKVHAVAVHRDISSDNIMVREDGEIRLLDFGTVRIVEENSELTMVGMNVGKTFYCAPEQFKDSRTVDQRADIYSIGILLFEMLSGKRIRQFEPITQHRADLHRGWDSFFATALATSREQRFPTAPAFRQAMEQLASNPA